ncbi:MAG: hypothetical protein YSLV5_ORF05 [Yellowstone Lake virophage 5]|uniref:Uncharacterized protein n=1 Tax=Yellowstone Lake virophage 5 TaxID=1557033 RepID=A0A0A0RK44_9VIRU|nr:MAG: hypothetical protein ASQ69_gp05 [Yellowstone Lake virophage 5]AIW01863.1 MAG: hypothetical protein YSLV5_ORF05 [Yellowstone Lake virophage 5]
MSSVASILTGTPAVVNPGLYVGGGGGGAQTLSQLGNSVSLSGGGGSVDISTTSAVSATTSKTTAMTYNGGLLSTTFSGDLFAERTQIGTQAGPTTLSVFQNIEQFGNGAIHQFYNNALQPQASVGLVGGVNLNITSSGGLTMGKTNTGSGDGHIDIIDGQVRITATDFVGLLDGTNLLLDAGLLDNNTSSGAAGQFLSCGAGGEVLWTSPGVDGVQSVSAGSNIAVDNTDPENPIVAVAITSDLDMTSHNLTNALNVGCETATVGEALNYVDSGSVICADTKSGFYQGLLCQNKSSTDHASANVVCVNDSLGSDYSALGINSSVFGNVYGTVFEIPNASYASGTADTVIGSQSDHVVSGNHSLYLAYNSGSGAFCINTQGALSMNASNPVPPGVLDKGDFGTAGQLLTSAGSGAPPTWEDPPALLTILGATVGDAPLNTVIPATWMSVTVNGGSYRIPLYQ